MVLMITWNKSLRQKLSSVVVKNKKKKNGLRNVYALQVFFKQFSEEIYRSRPSEWHQGQRGDVGERSELITPSLTSLILFLLILNILIKENILLLK